MASAPESSVLPPLLLLCLFLHLHPLFASVISAAPKRPHCLSGEMSALLELRDSFPLSSVSNDPLAYPKTRSWKIDGNKSHTDCCLWDGVDCDGQGHVIVVDLSNSMLYGSINSASSLFRLTHLERLNLAYNNFNYSRIPSGFSLLERLTHLNLSGSSFAGRVPSDILLLTRLVSLDLSDNLDDDQAGLLVLGNHGLGHLLRNLTNLEELNLAYVGISSPVPIALANLSSLRRLSLNNCGLYGAFPLPVFRLPNLLYLNMNHNENLHGQLPEFNESSPLESFLLGVTDFSGEIPVSIGNLTSLNQLDLSATSFSGFIPSSLGQLGKLNYLDIGENDFGSLPLSSLSWIWKMTKLSKLYLGKMNLLGGISPSIGNLTGLVELSLAFNQLTGAVPPQISNLTRLELLSFRVNNLSGPILPCLMNMTDLEFLNLASNRFSGEIPPSIYRLQKLQFVGLKKNVFTGSVDLDGLIQLKSLQALLLSFNQLSVRANITTPVRNAPQLEILGLSSCNLEEFPGFLRHQENLDWIDLSENKIYGDVPEWIWNLSSRGLEFMNLSHNFLTGQESDPLLLPHLNLRTLDLSHNKFKRPIPAPPKSILFYLISENELEGEIPSHFCELGDLVALDLSFNHMSGDIPGCLGNASRHLAILNLQSNGFHGTIPEFLANRNKLLMIDLSHNQLGGNLPRSLASCSKLEFIDLGKNRIDDTFPYWLGSLPELHVLILHSNKFHGKIDHPLSEHLFQKLQIIDLSDNAFSGTLPEDYFRSWTAMRTINSSRNQFSYLQYPLVPRWYLAFTSYGDYDYTMTVIYKGLKLYYPKIPVVLVMIDFSSNLFQGTIPDLVGELKGLQGLNFSNNFLTGSIPSSLGNLTVLESLDLSNNNLTGMIPQSLADITTLSSFSVAYNDLMGPIPRGKQFDTFPINSYEGNPGLCGANMPKNCSYAGGTQPQQFPTSNKDSDNSGSITDDVRWITIGTGFACGLVVGVVLGNLFASKKRAWFEPTARRCTKPTRRGR